MLLKWSGPPEAPMTEHFRPCMELSDVFILPAYRGNGIGTRLLDTAEKLARERGYPRLGLGVADDNVEAWRLYTRNGFRDSGLGTYPIKWTWIDDAGEGHPQEELCVYLIKTLDKEE